MVISAERLKELEACEELLMQVLDDQGMHEIYEENYPELYATAMGDRVEEPSSQEKG
jgi:hypothetical protein